jgi:hypothetical protein
MSNDTFEDIESRLEQLFDAQSRGLERSAGDPRSIPMTTAVAEIEARRLRPWIVGSVSVAAALVLVVAGIALFAGRDQQLTTLELDVRVRAETRQVSLTADLLTIEAGGEVFNGAGADMSVRSDAGDAHRQTLELEWVEEGVEMRMNMYFVADGKDWWVNEIRTYDGAVPSDWIHYKGEFFRTALGRAFHGDVDLTATDGQAGHLHLSNMTLAAFRPPTECGDETSAKYVVVPYADPVDGNSTSVDLFDATTCEHVDPRPFTAEWQSGDASIAEVNGYDFGGCAQCGLNADVFAKRVGETTGTVIVRDANADVVGSATFRIVVSPEALEEANRIARCTAEHDRLAKAIHDYRAQFGASTEPTQDELVAAGFLDEAITGYELSYSPEGAPRYESGLPQTTC